ncbi:MAG: molybdopterin oxidoreductase family protein, partial [Thermoleophilaceae bacterium]
PQGGDDRRNLWQELQKGTIDLLIFSICNPLRMQQQTTQLKQFVDKVPFIVDMNIRPSDTSAVADVVLPAAAWGEYTYTRENLERRLRVNQQFYDPPGEVRAEYLIFTSIAQRLASRHGLIDPAEWQFSKWEDVFNAMRQTNEGVKIGLGAISPEELTKLGTNGIQEPITRQGNTLTGTERMYTDKFATPTGKANFVPIDYQWTSADPLAFLPEPVKPNAQYPFFLTTIRYQTMWQSGYTYRWTHDLANHSTPFQEFMVNPKDAKKAGLKDGDWAEVSNQFSRAEGVVNVTTEVPPGVISALFGWQGPNDSSPNGNPQYYPNNLVAGGAEAQQKSNGAFYKNARAALKKLKRAPKTAKNAPGLSEKDRVGRFKGQGEAGNPDSKAKNFVSVQV